ncbi:MAG: hypothetical protein ACK4I0_01295 [Brevundimonas sp.]|uniref:hypothetical protein n=1 Tax=Brevundimonas sp. TaxID=1871086 RepID=UPI00391DC7DE
MKAYYCIVNMPGVPVREIAALQAIDDVAAGGEAHRVADVWPGFETVALYEGERSVLVIANPALGFSTRSLCLETQAA